MTEQEKHRKWHGKFRAKRMAEGCCYSCLSRKAGEDGGSRTLCGPCRRAAIARDEKRRRAKGIRPWAEYRAELEAKRKLHTVIIPRPIEQVFKKKPAERIERMLMLASVPKVSNLSL